MSINKRITAFLLLFAVLVPMCVFVPYEASVSAAGARPELIPCGTPFGVKFYTDGVIVVGVADVETAEGLVSPARDAGFTPGDVITAIDGVTVDSVEKLGEIIGGSGGKAMSVTVERDGGSITVVLSSVKSQSGDYRSGLWVRDSTAGIGTLTYISASDDTFGGLGHGICDSATGALLPLRRGTVVDVTVTGIVKGRPNEPGELKGDFSGVKRGMLSQNTERGVFGSINTAGMTLAEPIEIAYKSEVKEGAAQIMTSIDGRSARLYDIEIEKITSPPGDTKNYVIHVTDKELLSAAGGIVQGMSGSPVIQNGRLVGAVTHVMINDPTRGYGIFIENMLEAQKEECEPTGSHSSVFDGETPPNGTGRHRRTAQGDTSDRGASFHSACSGGLRWHRETPAITSRGSFCRFLPVNLFSSWRLRAAQGASARETRARSESIFKRGHRCAVSPSEPLPGNGERGQGTGTGDGRRTKGKKHS